MGYRLGIDVGGTFTDFALYDEATATLRIGKVLTTPDDPSEGVLQGLDDLLREAGTNALAVSQAIHATTLATNTVIQRNGPPIGLLTTAGFRDVLAIARSKRWELYNNAIDKAVPLVPRHRIWEARERLLWDGTVRTPLDEAGVRAAAKAMLAGGVRSAAICFLHSYVNPAHEERAAEILREEAPDLPVSLSSQVSPVFREYERASTTVVNAYVMPAVRAYIRRIEEGLKGRGFSGSLFVMQSNGGIAASDVVERFPIRIIESGPAAGALTAARYAEAAGTGNLLSFDMGGTTAKVCLIEGGRPSLTGSFEVDTVRLKRNSGLPINIPAIELVEIGAGGGSLAEVRMGTIVVGPESAGARPGPICYCRGGTRSTVTDADLVLGYLNPEYFLGGRMRLDSEGARRGIRETIGKPLGLDAVEAAWGIYEVVTTHMSRATRVVSVGKGKDPRQFAFIPFGGAGPMHGARLARLLGCGRIVFPKGAGVTSAIGLLMAEPAFDLARTHVTRLTTDCLPTVNRLYREMEEQGEALLKACRVDGKFRLSRSADVRFLGQGYEITVPLPSGVYHESDLPKLRQAFFRAYGATYGDRAYDPAAPVEVVHWRVTAACDTPQVRFEELTRGTGKVTGALKGHRPVYFPETKGFTNCPVYDRYALRTGDVVDGPAVVEERESTVVLLPDSRGTVDRVGNIIVDLSAG